MGLGLAAVLVVAAGPPSANPLTQGAQADGPGAPGADEALPPAADDFFGDQQDGTGQDSGSGTGGDAPRPGGTVSGDATVSPSPDGGQQGEESDDAQHSGDSGESGGSVSGSGGAGASSQPSTMAQQVVAIANDERAEAGCGPLSVDPELTAASKAHSQDMASRDYMAHETPEGEGPAERAEDAGYQAWSGENVAAGYTSAEAVMEGWMDSRGHRANILNCDNTEVGVGETDTKWAQNFGRG